MVNLEKNLKFKVINIVNHAPAYGNYDGLSRLKSIANWNDKNGKKVGILGLEWHDIQGNLVLNVSKNIEYEVWQPDYNASKIYEHTFETGLIHKLFPATNKKNIHGFRKKDNIYSVQIINALDELINKNVPFVLHINGLIGYLNKSILNRFGDKIPIVAQFYNNTENLFKIPKTKNLLKLANAYKKNFELSAYYKKLRYLIPSISDSNKKFEKKYGIKVFARDFYNFPIEFNNKSNIKSQTDSIEIENNKFVILSLSRLSPTKQIDKLIIVMSKIKYDFVCYIVGGGQAEYESYLKELVRSLGLTDKIKFIGQVPKNKVYKYYKASDLFISCSKLEGGPTTPFEAAAMGVPVVLTNTGIAYEFFKNNNVGKIIPTDNYNVWVDELEKILGGEEIKKPDILKVKEFGNKEKVSNYYRDIYQIIYNEWHRVN